MLAYTRNETMQILRDPVRLAFAFVGSALLMLVFGFGITTDVEHIRYATLDLDQSPESRAYLEQFAGVAALLHRARRRPRSADEALERLQSDDISLVLEIPPSFGRDFRRGAGPEVLAQVDGAMTFRGETIAQYVQGVHSTMLQRSRRAGCRRPLRRSTRPTSRSGTCTTRRSRASTRSCRASRRCCWS